MIPLFAGMLAVHPFELIRVDDPNIPGAQARSATGSVLLAPPEGRPWRYESVPHPDHWPAEEAIEVLNADEWHQDGVLGAGVKVAVFDLEWFGAELDPEVLGDVQTHDCYSDPLCALPIDTFRPEFSFEMGVHGYGCAQVVHDIAPDAELHLVRVNGETALENAVDWAIREDVDVISMSLSFFNTSFYDGSGSLNALMDRLEAADVLMVASVGNYARGHWAGAAVDADGDGRLDLDGHNGLWVELSAGSVRGIYLTWNQFLTCGTTDLDVRLVDSSGQIIGRSRDIQATGGDHCEPLERLTGTVPEDGWYRVEVTHERGPLAQVHLNLLATSGDLENSIPEGSLTDPSSHPAVFSVGAVRADGYFLNDSESFSSQGPTSDGRSKPDIVGPDGLTTEAYGAVSFYGTSAATPAVVGALALILSDNPSLRPYQAATRLQAWSVGGNPVFSQPSPALGSGRARLAAREDRPGGCGERPLLLPIFLLPLGWFRRRYTPT